MCVENVRRDHAVVLLVGFVLGLFLRLEGPCVLQTVAGLNPAGARHAISVSCTCGAAAVLDMIAQQTVRVPRSRAERSWPHGRALFYMCSLYFIAFGEPACSPNGRRFHFAWGNNSLTRTCSGVAG